MIFRIGVYAAHYIQVVIVLTPGLWDAQLKGGGSGRNGNFLCELNILDRGVCLEWGKLAALGFGLSQQGG
jgi:hypothetical protein